MQPQNPPGKVPKSEEIREPKSNYPKPDIEAKSPEFSVEKKQSEILSNEDQGLNLKDAPEVNDEQPAP